ncbi:MAG: penicillin-binding transpeptidase domain-containing protein [Chloroflexota bacterium]|nr:penicillin-binding transpeptidase domain-containing protein [Chloroflexota bacterium]
MARIRAARVRPLGINRGLVAAVAILCAMVLGACEPGPPPPEPIARQYAAAWQKSDYQAMWDLLTDDAKAQVTTAGFIDRLPRIAEEMTLASLEAKPGTGTHPALPNGSPDPRKASVPLEVTFHTQRVGDIARATMLQLVMVGEKDKAVWRIAWTPEAILPHLTAGRLVRMTRLPTSRGRIVARDGTELATFVEAGVVGVVTGQIRSEAGLLSSLSAALAMTPEQVKAKYTQSWVKPDLFVPVKIIPAAQLDALRTRLSLIEGVQVQATRVRSYPTGLASHTLGYLSEASDAEAKAKTARGIEAGDLIGKKDTGLEAALDDELGGSYGFRLGIVEPDERPVETLGETAPVPGRDVVLSLDPKLQRAAENALGENKGAIVAEDPWSGEILALASRPTFDLNALVEGDAAAIARYTSDPKRPFFNRATFGQYPTGSSFKPITAAAAMRNGVYNWGDRIDCPARWTGYGAQWVQLNHETGNLGPIDLRTALARSCNTFFYEIGKRLNDRDPNLLPNSAKSFGLGKATDIDFVFEAEGLVPSPDWKKQHFTNPGDQTWNPGDASNLAIGQGFLLATPLQMANYASALANDGILWKPRLVIELRERDGKTAKTYPKTQAGSTLAIPTDLSLIRDGMHAVTTDADGTVSFVFNGFATSTAGKSGTAESSTPGKVHAWFIGFASFEQPSIAIAAVLDEYTERPGVFGSVDSAIAVKAVLSARFATP